MKKPDIYILSHKIKWKAFKALNTKLVMDSGPTPRNMDKILWELLRDKRILCWFDPLIENDMCIGLELPKGRKIKFIISPSKK